MTRTAAVVKAQIRSAQAALRQAMRNADRPAIDALGAQLVRLEHRRDEIVAGRSPRRAYTQEVA